MQRTEFLRTTAAAGAALTLLPGLGPIAMADGHTGLWVRYVLGFGVPYQKQIGFGTETTPIATRPYVEMQVGMPGGSCNANTARKAYIRADHFGDLLTVYPVIAYVSGSGALISLDQNDPPPLRLLDSPHLYPRSVTPLRTRSERIAVPAAPSPFSENAIVSQKQVRDVTYAQLPVDGTTLLRYEVWSSPRVPLGIARIRASVHSMPAFELHLDSYGYGYHTEIAESLDAVRAQN